MVDLEALLHRDYEFRRRRSWWRASICFRQLERRFPHGFPVANAYAATQSYALDRRAEGAADATIRNELVALSGALVLAARFGVIRARPALAIPAVGDGNARKEFIRGAEVDRICAELEQPVRDLVRFAYITGFRRGEILGLTWSRVDWDRGAVVLEPVDTKNREPRLWPFASHPELRELLRARLAGRDGPYVFHRGGACVRDFRRSWKNACRESGVGRRFFHSLRRSAARNMILAGVPTQVVIKLLGWKSEAMLRRYCILDEMDLADEVAHYARNGRRNDEAQETDHQL